MKLYASQFFKLSSHQRSLISNYRNPESARLAWQPSSALKPRLRQLVLKTMLCAGANVPATNSANVPEENMGEKFQYH